jgi:hypothetical protein
VSYSTLALFKLAEMPIAAYVYWAINYLNCNKPKMFLQQKKYLDALEILDSDLREKITQQPANFVQLKRINYHLAQQQWKQAHAICKELIALQ